MATIVLHKPTGVRYVLIGTGFGAIKTISPGGNPFPREEGRELPTAAVSDASGQITWLYTKELQVVEVDGLRIGDYFNKGQAAYTAKSRIPRQAEDEVCPACQFRVSAVTKECPSCGLTLMSDENT